MRREYVEVVEVVEDPDFIPVIEESPQVRASFLRRTYAHLFGSVLAFMVLQVVFFQVLPVEKITLQIIRNPFMWLFVLLSFVGVSYVAERWAQDTVSVQAQYMGLGLFVVAEALLFLPLIYLAYTYKGMAIIESAAITTLLTFGGLTALVFFSKRDFSFMGELLGLIALGALGYIVCGIIFGFSLGQGFTILMIAMACGWILYDTSEIMHNYEADQHVAAALALFASVALLFWYVLQLFMSQRD